MLLFLKKEHVLFYFRKIIIFKKKSKKIYLFLEI